ncbi:hypothetical protein T492DRAFT_1123429 [Pavlovales sp. CCMP2436]|nr:hypothetical protein T492DRAFT_1123429 [Pavlovales sp. CCMP2436]
MSDAVTPDSMSTVDATQLFMSALDAALGATPMPPLPLQPRGAVRARREARPTRVMPIVPVKSHTAASSRAAPAMAAFGLTARQIEPDAASRRICIGAARTVYSAPEEQTRPITFSFVSGHSENAHRIAPALAVGVQPSACMPALPVLAASTHGIVRIRARTCIICGDSTARHRCYQISSQLNLFGASDQRATYACNFMPPVTHLTLESLSSFAHVVQHIPKIPPYYDKSTRSLSYFKMAELQTTLGLLFMPPEFYGCSVGIHLEGLQVASEDSVANAVVLDSVDSLILLLCTAQEIPATGVGSLVVAIRPIANESLVAVDRLGGTLTLPFTTSIEVSIDLVDQIANLALLSYPKELALIGAVVHFFGEQYLHDLALTPSVVSALSALLEAVLLTPTCAHEGCHALPVCVSKSKQRRGFEKYEYSALCSAHALEYSAPVEQCLHTSGHFLALAHAVMTEDDFSRCSAETMYSKFMALRITGGDGVLTRRDNAWIVVASVNGMPTPTADSIDEGERNKYFTQERFDASFAEKSTDDLRVGAAHALHTRLRAAAAPARYAATEVPQSTPHPRRSEPSVAATADVQLCSMQAYTAHGTALLAVLPLGKTPTRRDESVLVERVHTHRVVQQPSSPMSSTLASNRAATTTDALTGASEPRQARAPHALALLPRAQQSIAAPRRQVDAPASHDATSGDSLQQQQHKTIINQGAHLESEMLRRSAAAVHRIADGVAVSTPTPRRHEAILDAALRFPPPARRQSMVDLPFFRTAAQPLEPAIDLKPTATPRDRAERFSTDPSPQLLRAVEAQLPLVAYVHHSEHRSSAAPPQHSEVTGRMAQRLLLARVAADASESLARDVLRVESIATVDRRVSLVQQEGLGVLRFAATAYDQANAGVSAAGLADERARASGASVKALWELARGAINANRSELSAYIIDERSNTVKLVATELALVALPAVDARVASAISELAPDLVRTELSAQSAGLRDEITAIADVALVNAVAALRAPVVTRSDAVVVARPTRQRCEATQEQVVLQQPQQQHLSRALETGLPRQAYVTAFEVAHLAVDGLQTTQLRNTAGLLLTGPNVRCAAITTDDIVEGAYRYYSTLLALTDVRSNVDMRELADIGQFRLTKANMLAQRITTADVTEAAASMYYTRARFDLAYAEVDLNRLITQPLLKAPRTQTASRDTDAQPQTAAAAAYRGRSPLEYVQKKQSTQPRVSDDRLPVSSSQTLMSVQLENLKQSVSTRFAQTQHQIDSLTSDEVLEGVAAPYSSRLRVRAPLRAMSTTPPAGSAQARERFPDTVTTAAIAPTTAPRAGALQLPSNRAQQRTLAPAVHTTQAARQQQRLADAPATSRPALIVREAPVLFRAYSDFSTGVSAQLEVYSLSAQAQLAAATDAVLRVGALQVYVGELSVTTATLVVDSEASVVLSALHSATLEEHEAALGALQLRTANHQLLLELSAATAGVMQADLLEHNAHLLRIDVWQYTQDERMAAAEHQVEALQEQSAAIVVEAASAAQHIVLLQDEQLLATARDASHQAQLALHDERIVGARVDLVTLYAQTAALGEAIASVRNEHAARLELITQDVTSLASQLGALAQSTATLSSDIEGLTAGIAILVTGASTTSTRVTGLEQRTLATENDALVQRVDFEVETMAVVTPRTPTARLARATALDMWSLPLREARALEAGIPSMSATAPSVSRTTTTIKDVVAASDRRKRLPPREVAYPTPCSSTSATVSSAYRAPVLFAASVLRAVRTVSPARPVLTRLEYALEGNGLVNVFISLSAARGPLTQRFSA